MNIWLFCLLWFLLTMAIAIPLNLAIHSIAKGILNGRKCQ